MDDDTESDVADAASVQIITSTPALLAETASFYQNGLRQNQIFNTGMSTKGHNEVSREWAASRLNVDTIMAMFEAHCPSSSEAASLNSQTCIEGLFLLTALRLGKGTCLSRNHVCRNEHVVDKLDICEKPEFDLILLCKTQLLLCRHC